MSYSKNYIKHKYPQINHQVFSENNEYREDIETAIRVPIDNTHTFTKENTLRNLTPKAKLALQEAYTTAPNVYYAFKNLTKDYAFMFKKWNTLGIKSKEYCLELNKVKILITGGLGFIGAHLAYELKIMKLLS